MKTPAGRGGGASAQADANTVKESWIPADWPAPPQVRAGVTTRRGGRSRPPFDSLNLALHAGDDPRAVKRNRARLQQLLELPSAPCWLRQIHGSATLEHPACPDGTPEADGIRTRVPGEVCAVLAADCLPLLLCNKAGSEIAAAHMGWRGLCRGIIGNAVSAFATPPAGLLAWLGPRISQDHYEVGEDVARAWRAGPGAAAVDDNQALRPGRAGHWQLDLGGLATIELKRLGVTQIHDCGRCAWEREDLFYSCRRDGQTGRMAALIWLEP